MKENKWEPDLGSLLKKKMPVMEIFNLQLNSDAIKELESKAEEFGIKKSSIARVAINYALSKEDFWKLLENLERLRS